MTARIMVVEDNSVSRGLMTYLLESQGYIVAAFEDAGSALAGVPAFRPDLVLCDLLLPGLDGAGLARRLKAPGAAAGIALAAITASDGRTVEAEALAAGFQVLLRKPIEPDAFLFEIGEILSRTAEERRSPAVALDGLRRSRSSGRR